MRFVMEETYLSDVEKTLLSSIPNYRDRYLKVRKQGKSVRISEYLITNACNIRCKGCWFYEYDFDKSNTEIKDLDKIKNFIDSEKLRGINSALIIGGEPALFPGRVKKFVENFDNVTISTNGLKRLPMDGFENLSIIISLFGGGILDDDLRAIKPNGKSFSGLFDRVLLNYKGDPRVVYNFALTEDGINYIEETVEKIDKNGSRVNFNFYSKYDNDDPLKTENQESLLNMALSVKEKYPDTVISHPYYIKAMITGESHWGRFGYDVCPSISVNHPSHVGRISNGNPTLPLFNAIAADYDTINFCCTSGHCDDCRDSQAVHSWLVVSKKYFMDDPELFKIWIELAESYWSQFYWSSLYSTSSNFKNNENTRLKIIVTS